MVGINKKLRGKMRLFLKLKLLVGLCIPSLIYAQSSENDFCEKAFKIVNECRHWDLAYQSTLQSFYLIYGKGPSDYSELLTLNAEPNVFGCANLDSLCYINRERLRFSYQDDTIMLFFEDTLLVWSIVPYLCEDFFTVRTIGNMFIDTSGYVCEDVHLDSAINNVILPTIYNKMKQIDCKMTSKEGLYPNIPCKIPYYYNVALDELSPFRDCEQIQLRINRHFLYYLKEEIKKYPICRFSKIMIFANLYIER